MHALHAMVLTLNEEIHLTRCLESIKGVCTSITVIDSGSTDRTVEIAKNFGVEVITNPFVNHSAQTAFAIEHLRCRGGWLLRIDADEYLCEGAAEGLAKLLGNLPDDVDGVYLRLRRVFMGRWLKHGGLYPLWLLRVWRNGHGRCEPKWMDEYISVEGKIHYEPLDFADHTLRPLIWWSTKHVDYATREAIDLLLKEDGKHDIQRRPGLKYWIKNNVYNSMPSGLRSFGYFLWRYVVGLGFLDGKAGYYFHALQGLWYRTLVDAITDEIRRNVADGATLEDAIARQTGRRIAIASACEVKLPSQNPDSR